MGSSSDARSHSMQISTLMRDQVAKQPIGGRHCGGFTYIALLFIVALMGAALVGIGQIRHVQVQRDKEAELLFVGNQFRRAISLYYERAPGGARQYPKQLQDLLQDPRYPNVQRHLRKLYMDPMTGKAEWGLVRTPDGSIIGVYSLSEDMPIKTAGFTAQDAGFADSISYREWKFAYLPADARGAGTKAAPGSQPGGQPGLAPGQQPLAAGQSLSPDPAAIHELEMAARQPGCRAQRTRELEACGQSGAPSKDCITAASRRYDACLGGSSSVGQ
jgi:type II secretory pathway pseudopilin PulG